MGQTVFNFEPAAAMSGLIADSGIDHIVSRINKGVAQITTVTIASVVDSTDYTVTINGVPCLYTSDGTATEAEINAGLLAAINTSAFNGLGLAFDVTAVQGATTATIVITADVIGTPFTCTVTAVILTVATTAENSGDIPFGVVVAQNTEDDEARLPTSGSDKLLGVSVLDQTEPNQSDGTHEYEYGDAMGIMIQGRIWVTAEDAVAAQGDVYVRHTASGNGTQLGAIRSDNDGGAAMQLTGAVFETSAGAGELAVVNLNRP